MGGTKSGRSREQYDIDAAVDYFLVRIEPQKLIFRLHLHARRNLFNLLKGLQAIVDIHLVDIGHCNEFGRVIRIHGLRSCTRAAPSASY